MTDSVVDRLAQSLFSQHQKLFAQSEVNWLGIGPEARGHWRHLARIALGSNPPPASRCNIPEEWRARVRNSPILSRVPAARFLRGVLSPIVREMPTFGSLDEYLPYAKLHPVQRIGTASLPVIDQMDRLKRKLAQTYSGAPQDEVISIVMPTRNRAGLISDSILSVLVQSYENWELLVVDDGGEDDTEAVVRRFRDSRIHYLRLTVQCGCGPARNAGLARAQGTIIAYLDDDDQWDPDFLLISKNEMRKRAKKMIYSAQIVWDGFDPHTLIGKRVIGVRFTEFDRYVLERLNYISMICCIHDRELLDRCGRFAENLDRFLDWDLFLRFTEEETPASVPCILSHYFKSRDLASVSGKDNRDESLRKLRDRLALRSNAGRGTDVEPGKAPVSGHEL